MKKILITGGKGMLGSKLAQVLTANHHEVFALSSSELNITDYEVVKKQLDLLKPNILINCAAYTKVDLAETEIDLSNNINGFAVGNLAKECLERKIKFIQISTDYVFGDNNKNGYDENYSSKIEPQNQYGKSKKLGEVEALKNNSESLIVRTSWVFGPNGKNFVDTMLKLAETKTELSIVSDEFGIPTSTEDISKQIKYIIDENLKPGIYHAVSEGSCSRFEEAVKIFEIAGKDLKLNKILLKDYPRPAKIPNYSILLNTKLPKLSSWKNAIEEYVKGY